MKHSRRYANAQRRYKRNAGAGNIRHFIERWVAATGPVQIAEVREGEPLDWKPLGAGTVTCGPFKMPSGDEVTLSVPVSFEVRGTFKTRSAHALDIVNSPIVAASCPPARASYRLRTNLRRQRVRVSRSGTCIATATAGRR